MKWTPDLDKLITIRRGAISATKIADEVGCTRNAVIGRWHRLGLERLTNPLKGGRKGIVRAKKPQTKKPSPIRLRAVIPQTRAQDLAIPEAQRRSIYDLTEATCRWPVGDPDKPDFFFCGARPLTAHPYCAGHCAVAHEGFACAA